MIKSGLIGFFVPQNVTLDTKIKPIGGSDTKIMTSTGFQHAPF
jgi:hypothetical protein